MSDAPETKGDRREMARKKARNGMRVTGKYFWIAIENSRAKREQAENKRDDEAQPHEK